MDQYRVINQLERMKDSKKLIETTEYQIKDRDRPSFEPKSYFEKIIFGSTFMIWTSKVFYTWNQKPLDNGILDLEELTELPDAGAEVQNAEAAPPKEEPLKFFIQGPYSGDNDTFSLVMRYGESDQLLFKSRTYQLPDAQQTMMLTDFDKQVDMSTFLDSGDILLKIKNRFMIFDKYGMFIDEAEFKDLRTEQDLIALKRKAQKQKAAMKLWRASSVIPEEGLEAQEQRDNQSAEEDEEADAELLEETKVKPEDRMVLVQLSSNNKFFLFVDREKELYKVYTLAWDPDKVNEKKFGAKKKAAGLTRQLTLEAGLKRKSVYYFEPVFEFDVFRMQMFRDLRDEKAGAKLPEEERRAEITRLMDNTIGITVGTEGSVTLCCSQHGVLDTAIKVFGTIVISPKTDQLKLLEYLDIEQGSSNQGLQRQTTAFFKSAAAIKAFK